MKLRTFSILLCLATVSGATTFTPNLKALHGQVPASAWGVITQTGCGSFVPVTGSGATLPVQISLYPVNRGAISATVQDEAGHTCGTSTGTAYYHQQARVLRDQPARQFQRALKDRWVFQAARRLGAMPGLRVLPMRQMMRLPIRGLHTTRLREVQMSFLTRNKQPGS